MATAPFMNGKDDGTVRRVKLLDQILNQSAADERMVDQAEQHSVGARRQASQRRLNGAQLPFLPIFIDYDFIGFEVDRFCDGFRVRAEHDSADADISVRRYFQQMFKEGPPLVGK